MTIAEMGKPSVPRREHRVEEVIEPVAPAGNNDLQISQLYKSSVRMKDPRRVVEIIESMRLAGSSTLQVISDFDMTLTRFACNGTRCPTCHNILDNSALISGDCKKMLRELLDKYYPIEFDASLTVEEKVPHMVDWWTKAHKLLIEQKIQKDLLARAVKDSNAMLRDDYKLFFDHLLEDDIPLVIFSAGIGDVLEEVIRQAGVFHSNIMVFSNYMDFDAMGTLQAFKGKLIHTFNKNGLTLVESSHFPRLRDRHNVLLLGDSLGDLNMVDGLPDTDNILKIGFLNDKVEEWREPYMNSYDIVLEKDETMDVPNAILNYITGHQ
ncbi:7-methylguanosine phosphate-specific 5'-nucleotidase-like isoform X2 [Brienomyrus brachyistius]|uniref:7-methylguanosine phosphate-specific 5'-nucleotidase-like isoform X2 n=1 Tax=Brienomyrus brachyistius TaxID=42636 RepID=UPI0020B3D6D1|nr:7-methylguanosine phosphate-specific 5'-nucleotidase-like isoform X2 [Brienomyrus brachyistius]